MPATVVVGAQFGDEGKGKIVDYLADRADVVVRFQGGANAGHTVQVGDQLYAFHLLPSGVLRPRSMNVIGNGVVIDPPQLLKEIAETRALGHSVENLRISDRAHVVMSYHKIIDGLEEKLKGNLGAGTTLRGIGPSFEDKVGRFGIRMCDLVDPLALREKLETMVPIKQRLIDAYGGTERLDLEAIYKEQVEYGARLAPFVADTSVWVDAAIRRRKRVLFEGAQGTLLCIDHGIYPFGTSSDCVAGAASVGAGVGPQFLTDIVGVAKAFTSRVGTGPFPTEVEGATAEYLRERGGGEYGTTTRRPRRVGWLDLVMLRMAVRVNGLTSLAVTKLDVLGAPDRVPADGRGPQRSVADVGQIVDSSARAVSRRVIRSRSSHALHTSFPVGSPHRAQALRGAGGYLAWRRGRIWSYPLTIACRVPGLSSSRRCRISRNRPRCARSA